MNLEALLHGRWNSTVHWHTHEAGRFYILDGEGLMRIGRREVKVGPGSYAVFRPHGKLGHALKNTGKKSLRSMVIGTRESGDVCVYPDSNKVSVRALTQVGRLKIADHWDGEA